MPAFRLSPDETRALVIFLKSRRGMNFTETSLERYRARLGPARVVEELQPPSAGQAPPPHARGEELVRARACTACHRLGADDGTIAPDLSFEGLIRDEAWLFDHFKDPRALVPDSIMPTFRFVDAEFRAMAAYLGGLETKPPFATPAGAFRDLCARCHGETGAGNGPIGLYLDPAPRDLTKAAFMNSKTTERLLQSVRGGVPGTSMPPWGRALDEGQRRATLDHVFAAFVKQPRREPRTRAVPGTNPVAVAGDSVARGEQIFLRRCTGCHGRKADGKGPNSIDIVPRPRNLRNRQFVRAASDRRLLESVLYGVQGTAMPPWVDYGLSARDAGDVVNYVRSLNAAP
jgi:mono/diheme cytochrome c family protein